MKTHFVLFLAFVVYGYGDCRNPIQELDLDNGLGRGIWGPREICDDDSWVSSLNLKFETEGHIDDTGANGVMLYCQTPEGYITNTLMSKVGSYGDWQGLRSCDSGKLTVAMRAYVMPDQGEGGDDKGVLNVQMKCEDGLVMDGLEGGLEEDYETGGDYMEMDFDDEGHDIGSRKVQKIQLNLGVQEEGVWSTWATCKNGTYICGLSTEVEHESAFSDDAGLCNLEMYCCT